jgi:hypothetical protein
MRLERPPASTIPAGMCRAYKGEQLDKFRERRDDCQQAFEEAVTATSTPWAPWYVVPADHRWYRNYVIARVLAGTLQAMDPQYPEPPEDVKRFAEEELKAAG